MKKILTLATIATIGLATFSSCKKNDSTAPSYSMTATVGSTAFSASNSTFTTLPTGTGTDSSLQIDGVSASGFPSIALHINTWNQTTGTTNLDAAATTGMGEYAASASVTGIVASQSGSVAITSVSASTISGTFSFTCTDGTVISGGKFTAKRLN